MDIEIGLKRRSSDQESWNRLDAKEQAFHQRVRNGYLEMADAQPGRWAVVDASQPLEQVRDTLIRVVFDRLAEAKKSPS